MRPIAEARKLRLIVSLGDRPSDIQGDATRLQQAIRNILDNAVKLTPEGGSIDVTSEIEPLRVSCTISDGIRISSEMLPINSQYLWQADGSKTRRFGGLGKDSRKNSSTAHCA